MRFPQGAVAFSAAHRFPMSTAHAPLSVLLQYNTVFLQHTSSPSSPPKPPQYLPSISAADARDCDFDCDFDHDLDRDLGT
eukprot:2043345-Rhodomonas_salina.1